MGGGWCGCCRGYYRGSHGGGSSNNDADKPSDNNATDTTAPAKPTVEAKDNGSVSVTPPADPDTQSVEVNYTNEAGNPKTATLTKGEDGNWTSNNPDVAVDPATGKATIPADKVKDGSPVTAKATDNAGNTGEEGTANAGNNPDTTAPAQPTVEAKMNGFVYITPPADEDTKSVEVHYIDEKGNPQTVTITKDADKGWVSSNPENIWLNSKTGEITLLAHKVKGDSLVKASATDNQGNTGEEATANAVNITDTYGPTIPLIFSSLYDYTVKVELPKEADIGDSVVISRGNYIKSIAETGVDFEETLATLTKQQDGSWISDKPENVPNVDAGNNHVIFSASKLKGFDFVDAYAIDPAGNKSFTFNEDWHDTSNRPDITVKTDGFIEITPFLTKGLTSIEIRYTDEAGTQKITTLTKGEEGNWTSDNQDVTVEPATGKAMISVDKIQDTSTVYARTFTNSDMVSNWTKTLVDKNPDAKPSAPEVIPSTTDGSVTVKVPDDAKVGDTVKVDIIPETAGVYLGPEYYDRPITRILTKNADGSWTSTDTENYPDATIVPHIAAGQNSATIPQDQVKDGSNVVVKTIDTARHESAEVTAQAGKDTGAPNEAGGVSPNNIGSSGDDFASFKQIVGTLNMGAGNDILEARSTERPFYLNTFDANIDMGSGDDIVKTSGPIQNYLHDREISIDGGDDFDTFKFENRDGKAIITTISALSNFEKIDITGTLNNTVNIQKEDVERNHNAKPTVDDSGESHKNVLIIDGNAGDKVNLNDISNVASSQVTYKDKTYHVYQTGSNELWIESDIAVV